MPSSINGDPLIKAFRGDGRGGHSERSEESPPFIFDLTLNMMYNFDTLK